MGRKKVRNYPSKKYYEEIFNSYFEENHDEVIESVCEELGYGSFEALREAEYSMKFGLDCGFVKIYPKNHEMAHEWVLDEGGRKGDWFFAEIYPHFAWNCQSLTCKLPQAKKAIRDLGLEEEFGVTYRYD